MLGKSAAQCLDEMLHYMGIWQEAEADWKAEHIEVERLEVENATLLARVRELEADLSPDMEEHAE